MKRILSLILLVALLLLMPGCDETNPGYMKVVDDGGNVVTIDSATRAIVTVAFEHHQIHDGLTFTVMEVTDLGNGAVRDILVVSPNTTTWAHLVWEIEHELETSIQFYRDTTYTFNGTAIGSFNRHGNSLNVATTLVYHTPTITNVGTLVAMIQQGDGKKAGGSDRLANEFILKQDTAYLIRITNLTVNDNLIFMKLNWYEFISK